MLYLFQSFYLKDANFLIFINHVSNNILKGGQMSGKCLAQLPSPPTTSPIGSGGLDFYYPDYDSAWSEATCKNDAPLPFANKNDRPTYDSKEACCKGAYSGQVSHSCMCDADPCYSCTCGDAAYLFLNKCSLDCGEDNYVSVLCM